MNHFRKVEIEENLAQVEARIAESIRLSGRKREDVTLVVVTKTFPVEDALFLYELGIRDFGENRDQEGSSKAPQLPADARWHFQGQIQSRKIPSILDWADVIHSLDSLEQAQKLAAKAMLGKEYFLQINFEVDAEHRGGIQVSEIESFLESSAVPISGLMVVPPLKSDPLEIFSRVAKLAQVYSLQNLSMGMSGDYQKAIEAGATHVRVGSSILGSRPPLT